MKNRPRLGRPLKAPSLGRRVPLCVRIPEATLQKLKSHARRAKCSQADVIVAAIDQLP